MINIGTLKRDKPLAPSPEDGLPYPVPPGWQWARFGEVAQISSGVTLGRKAPISQPIELPYLRVANVQRGELALASMKEVIIDRSELPRFQVMHGDLLITDAAIGTK